MTSFVIIIISVNLQLKQLSAKCLPLTISYRCSIPISSLIIPSEFFGTCHNYMHLWNIKDHHVIESVLFFLTRHWKSNWMTYLSKSLALRGRPPCDHEQRVGDVSSNIFCVLMRCKLKHVAVCGHPAPRSELFEQLSSYMTHASAVIWRSYHSSFTVLDLTHTL